MLVDNFSIFNVPAGKKTIAIQPQDGSPWIKLPIGNEMLEADFHRQSHNLLIDTPDQRVVIENYFLADHFPALLSETGQKIMGNAVNLLAGPESPLQFAGPVAMEGDSIGVVEKIQGEVTANRGGQEIRLTQGDEVYQDDVIVTDHDGSIGITFEDGSVFTLGSAARMTLDNFVYDPETGEGESSVSVIKGMFKFVSGEIAANNPGDMQVETPVATIGIRGTTGGGSVQGEGGDNQFFLEPNADGTVGWFDVKTANGTVSMNQPNTMVGLKSFNEAPAAPHVVSPQQLQQQFGTVMNFAPAGKYESRQNDREQPENGANSSDNTNTSENTSSSEEAGGPQEGTGEEAGDQPSDQEAKAENAGPEETPENPADAKMESEQSAADSEVSANGEQSGEALDSFSGNENFDGNAVDGKADASAGNQDQSTGESGGNETEAKPDASSSGSGADAPEHSAESGNNGKSPGDNPNQPSAPPTAPVANAPSQSAPPMQFIATGTASEGGPVQSGFKTVTATATASNTATKAGNGPQPNTVTHLGPNPIMHAQAEGVKKPANEYSSTESSSNNASTLNPLANAPKVNASTLNSLINNQQQANTGTQPLNPPSPPNPLTPPPTGNTPLTPPSTTNPVPNPGGTSTLPGGSSTLPGGTSTLPGGNSTVNGGNSTLSGGNNTVNGGNGNTTPPTTFTLTGGTDNFVGTAVANTFIIATLATDLNAADTLAGGGAIDTLQINAQGNTYTVDTASAPFTAMSGIDRLSFMESFVTLTLTNAFMQSTDNDTLLLNQGANTVEVHLMNDVDGTIGVEGSGQVEFTGGYAIRNVTNIGSASVTLDFLSSSRAGAILNGGSNHIYGGSGELFVDQTGGANHVITLANGLSDIVLDNTGATSVFGGSGEISLSIENSDHFNFMSGSGKRDIVIEDSDYVSINISGSNYDNLISLRNTDATSITGSLGNDEISLEGFNTGLVLNGMAGIDTYDFHVFSGDAVVIVNSGDEVKLNELNSGTSITSEHMGGGMAQLSFGFYNLFDMNIGVDDYDSDTQLDLRLTFSTQANREVILSDFFSAGKNQYYVSDHLEQMNLSNSSEYGLYTMGSITIGALPAVGDTVTIDGITLTFVAGSPNTGEIELGIDIASTLDNMAGALNAEPSLMNSYRFGHDDDTKLYMRSLAPEATPATIAYTGSGFVTIEQPNYQCYFTAKGNSSTPWMEWANFNASGSVLSDYMQSVEVGQILHGLDGNDIFYVGSNNAMIYGDGGNDRILKFDPNSNFDATLSGGDGTDTLDYSGHTTNLTVNLSASGTVHDNYFTDNLQDSFENFIGGSGNDSIMGTAGNNSLEGGVGHDSMFGGAGKDTLIGGAGDDSMDGGAGTDTLSYEYSGAVIVDLSNNANNQGDAYGDVYINLENVIGSHYGDHLTGSSDANIIEGLGGADTIDGGAGFDTVSYERSNAAVSIDLTAAVQSGGDAQGDQLTSIEAVIGSQYNDTITAGTSSNDIHAGYGDDVIVLSALQYHSLDGGMYDYDTLRLQTGAGVDLTPFSNGISNIEALQLTGNDLTHITLNDILNITDDRNELKIEGTGGETVTLLAADGWIEADDPNNGTYTTYFTTQSGSSVEVNIANTVNVNLA